MGLLRLRQPPRYSASSGAPPSGSCSCPPPGAPTPPRSEHYYYSIFLILATRAERADRRTRQRQLQDDSQEQAAQAAEMANQGQPQAFVGIAPGPAPQTGGAPAAAADAYVPLAYHGLPQKPPTLDVDLDTCNFTGKSAEWLDALHGYARIRRCMPAVEGAPAAPADMEDEISNVIRRSIPDEAFDQGLPISILRESAFSMIQSIRHFVSDTSTVQDFMNLHRTADQMVILKDESVDDYCLRHTRHRRAMIESKVPGIEDESVTVNYAVLGLRSRPSLNKHVVLLQSRNHPTVRGLRKDLRNIVTTEDRLYQERSARGRGRGGRGRGGSLHDSKTGTTITPSDASEASKASPSSKDGSSKRGSRGGSRGRGKTRHANAVMEDRKSVV